MCVRAHKHALLWPAARRPRRNMEPEAGVVLTLVADEEPQEGQEGAALAVNIDYDAPLPAQPFFAGEHVQQCHSHGGVGRPAGGRPGAATTATCHWPACGGMW